MKKVYVSLPISGYDIKDVKERAERATRYLAEKGYEAVTPFDVSPDENASYAEHMGRDIHALLDCDAVLFLRGWENSKGCQLERQAAIIYEKEMMHDASTDLYDLERVLPYPPLTCGDIVTYRDCLTTKAVYFRTLEEKNDSGDDCFVASVAKTGDKIYHGHMIFAEDMRLASPREVFDFIYKLDGDMITLKARNNDMEKMIDAYKKAGLVSEANIAQDPKAYECFRHPCLYRTPSGRFAGLEICRLQGCKSRNPYEENTDKAAATESPAKGTAQENPKTHGDFIYTHQPAGTTDIIMGFDPAMENDG